ncbi:hypothetical protein CTI12_AA522740 [Artemisia annua]|uniref:Uncharacterized protein n=1 Tax=Artemisia annua TaxID=35608 RepID=A0A2U1L792_ARTAN|nr:hypothetical protein CTI12_AA522740 [Artemisia annua]
MAAAAASELPEKPAAVVARKSVEASTESPDKLLQIHRWYHRRFCRNLLPSSPELSLSSLP